MIHMTELNIFLNSIERKINDADNDMLMNEIELSEIENILKSVESKKSPGVDGIPYEFYQTFWDLIKIEFT